MLKMNLQLFAHKKGVGVLPRTAVIPNLSAWAPKEPMVR